MSNHNDLGEWLSLEQMADLIGCSTKMLAYHRRMKDLEGTTKNIGGSWLFHRDMLGFSKNFRMCCGTNDRTKWGKGWEGSRDGNRKRAKATRIQHVPFREKDSSFSIGLARNALRHQDRQLEALQNDLKHHLGLESHSRKPKPSKSV